MLCGLSVAPRMAPDRCICLLYGPMCSTVVSIARKGRLWTSLTMTRANSHQCQHLYPCSGCLRCSDAMTPVCRRRLHR